MATKKKASKKVEGAPIEVVVVEAIDDERREKYELDLALRDNDDPAFGRSDTGDDAEGEVELAYSLRDNDDDPQFSEDLFVEEISVDLANPVVATATIDEIDPVTAEVHQVVGADLSVLSEREMGFGLPNPLLGTLSEAVEADFGPKAWDAPKALVHFKGTTTNLLKIGSISQTEKDAWDELAGTLKTHYDVFSFQAAVLFFVRDRVQVLALKNHLRLGQIETYGFWEKNQDWISCILGVAKKKFSEGYSVAFPGQDGFVPQTLTNDDRDELSLRIDQLMYVVRVATCQGCGKWVGLIKKEHMPFEVCRECHDSQLRHEESERDNLKLEEKKNLIEPLEFLLAELESTGVTWVDDQVNLGRTKAQEAYDREFKSQVKYLVETVKKFWVSVKLGAISEADVESVGKVANQIETTTAEIRTFKHLTWCGCGAPTYPWTFKGKPMKAGKDCETCRRAGKQKPAVSSEAVSAEIANELANDGIVVQLANEQSGEGLQRFQKRQVAAERERERREGCEE